MRFFAISWLFWLVLILSLRAIPDTATLLGVTGLLLLLALKWPVMRLFCAAYFFAAGVLLLAFIRLESHQLQSGQVSQDIQLVVRIASIPRVEPWGQRFTADVLTCETCDQTFGPKKIGLSWYGQTQPLKASEHWRLTVRLKPYRNLRNAGSFDRVRWAVYKGLDAAGYVKSNTSVERLETLDPHSVLATREALALQLDSLPSASQHSGLVQALILGIKHNVEPEFWNLLRRTGTSHLLAISGLHISLLATWAFLVSRRTTRILIRPAALVFPGLANVDLKIVTLIMSLGCATIYALLAGFELPVKRAILMLLVWGVAFHQLRHLAPLSGLLIAMIIVLCADVLSVLSPGFWLSFGTVAILFYLHRGRINAAESQEVLYTWRRRFKQKILPIIRTHTYLGLILLPITAWFFQTGSLVGPLANLIAVPWVGLVVVPLSFLTVLLAEPWQWAANIALVFAQQALNLLVIYLEFLSDWDEASISIGIPGTMGLIFSLTGMLLLFSPRGAGLKWFSLPLLLPGLLFNGVPSNTKGFEVHVLDVGQGLAALIFTPTRTVLFDTGGKLSVNLSMFEAVILPYLLSRGRRQIDTLVLSHDDEDHAFGLRDVINRFPNIDVYAGGDFQRQNNAGMIPCTAGTSWQLDGVSFSFVHPAPADVGSDNDRSCGLLVHLGASRALLLGDIEQGGEHLLSLRIQHAQGIDTPGSLARQFPVDLMIAPHHGSQSSSSERLLRLLTPKHVVFPAGYRNRYGFPHVDVQLRYKLVGAKQYVTGEQGATLFKFGDSGLLTSPETWWQSDRRFWHGLVNPACLEQFSGQAIVIRQLLLAQKGHKLCGK